MKEANNLCELLPLGRSLAVVTKTYIGVLAKKLEHFEVERYYSILIVIEKAQKCSQQHISDTLKTDKVSLVRIMNFLIKKKFVKRVVNPADRRENRIELTPKSKKLMPQIHAAIQEINKSALKGLGKTNVDSFFSYLSRIRQNLEELPAKRVFVKYTRVKNNNI